MSSLRRQTLQDIEIILVNDGSTDQSLRICVAAVKQDDRIRVINKPNGGGSSARNVGLDVATGHHIGFVDSDDWVEPMDEVMYRRVSETDADVCICKTT